MHKDFGEWYRLAGIEPDREILPKRWASIEEYGPDRADVVSLSRLFYGLGKPNSEFLAAFRGSFQKTDLAFKMRDNDHELSVLAGAKLVDVIERSEADLADLAALSLVCASAGNLRPCPSVRDIPEFAASYLSERAIKRASLGEETADTGTNKEPLAPLTTSETPQKELAREIQRLHRQLSIVAEETNMLWWLFSEHSRDEQQRWEKFNVPAVALMAGKELADLTTIIPGPIAAAAFLDRVIQCAESKPPTTVLIRDAINDVTIKWRQHYANQGCPAELQDLLPMTRAVHLSLTSPENNAWLPAFKQETGISSDAGIAPQNLAHQMFLEALLCRSWKQLN